MSEPGAIRPNPRQERVAEVTVDCLRRCLDGAAG